ncbi:DUF2029 domain-containing protein [Patescibacteria group bacterium]|nr:DUF2029 domain-containing protein [Patescibacteria group bacterium]
MKNKNDNTELFRKLIGIFLFCFFVSIILAILIWENFVNALGSDLVSFLTGAKIIWVGQGKLLYNLNTQYNFQSLIANPHRENFLLPFRNVPLFALFFIPLSFLPLLTAYKIFTLTLVVIALLVSRFSLKIFDNLKGSYWFALPFIFHPSFGSIFAGQVSILLLFLFMSIYYYLRKGSLLKSGFLVGLLVLKIQYIISFPFIFFLVKDKKNFLKGFFISSSLILLGSIFISGIDFFKDYIYMLVNTQNPNFGTKAENMFTLYSSLAQISPFSSFPKQSLFLINLLFYSLSIWIFYKNHKKISKEAGFTILTLLTLIFSLHGVNHDLALLVLPLWLLIDKLKKGKKADFSNILVIFILILSPLTFVLKVSYLTSFLFIFSVALLFRSSIKN